MALCVGVCGCVCVWWMGGSVWVWWMGVKANDDGMLLEEKEIKKMLNFFFVLLTSAEVD